MATKILTTRLPEDTYKQFEVMSRHQGLTRRQMLEKLITSNATRYTNPPSDGEINRLALKMSTEYRYLFEEKLLDLYGEEDTKVLRLHYKDEREGLITVRKRFSLERTDYTKDDVLGLRRPSVVHSDALLLKGTYVLLSVLRYFTENAPDFLKNSYIDEVEIKVDDLLLQRLIDTHPNVVIEFSTPYLNLLKESLWYSILTSREKEVYPLAEKKFITNLMKPYAKQQM